MGAKVSRTDFEWVYTEQPHCRRRKLILEKHPEIRQLFGPSPTFNWMIIALVLLQFAMIRVVRNLSWTSILLLSYCFGAFLNHALMMAIHEIAHNLAFGHNRPLHNRLFGFFANLPIGIPISISFKKYHLEHHRYQGDEVLDADLPSSLEAKLFCTTWGKAVWLLFHPLFFSLRPLLMRPMLPTFLEIFNAVIQLAFDGTVIYLYGWKALGYLIFGSLMGVGLHPTGAHFISDHYMFKSGFETFSYYGPLNLMMFNAGYHNEHHDFPAVSCLRLPEIKRLAPEFYCDLPQHDSWWRVFYQFVADPSIGPYARIKRRQKLHRDN